MNRKIQNALFPTPPDERDIKFSAIHTPINLNEIAGKNFDVFKPTIKDQGNTLKCTAYSSSYLLEAHEGDKISEDYIWKNVCRELNDKDPQGTDLRTIAKVVQKYGAIYKKDEPEWVKTASEEEKNDWTKWDASLDEKAKEHAQKTYFWITQDSYPSLGDAIRAALWQYRDKNNLILTGAMWRNSWTSVSKGVIQETFIPEESTSGHAFALSGQIIIGGKPYIKNPESLGTDDGDNGYYYFPVNVLSRELAFGALMFTDMPPEKAKDMQEKGITLQDNWLIDLAKRIKFFVLEIFY